MTDIISGIIPSGEAFTLKMIAVVIAAYLIGSISPSIIIAKAKGIDIKKSGSGNAGTTNVLRVIGKKAAAATLLIDILKGVAAVWLGMAVSGKFAAMICVFAVFAGHVWPLYFKFKGGKGVATLFGALLVYSWQTALIALGIVIIVTAVTRRMSAGSIAGAVSLPVISLFLDPGFFIPSFLICLLLIWKHKDNIKRLAAGTEPKIGEKNRKQDQAEQKEV